ncbi:MAG: ribonuclease HII [Pseudobdellovibrionaceae bacterium]|jgi:ribonuclease HII
MSKNLEYVDYTNFNPAPVLGLDEVGRGCLAGPVVAAAVVVTDPNILVGLTDSKLLSEKRRNELSKIILETQVTGIAEASVAEIEELNILHASLLAMHRAALKVEEKLGQRCGHLLIDGTYKIPNWKGPQTCLIKGDLRCLPISAASIIAKVYRDDLMKRLGAEFPQYQFEKHKGYASETHRTAIQSFGPSPHHRRTFGGVKEYLASRT